MNTPRKNPRLTERRRDHRDQMEYYGRPIGGNVVWAGASATIARVCACVLLLLCAATPAAAQTPVSSTFVWTGLGDGSSWMDGANWDKGHPPYDSHSVLIPNVHDTDEVVFDDERSPYFLRGITSYEPIRVVEDLRFSADGLVAHARVHVPSGGTLVGRGGSSIGGTGIVQLAGGRIVGQGDLRLDGNIRGFGSIVNQTHGATTRLTGTATAEFYVGPYAWNTSRLDIAAAHFVNDGTVTAVDGGHLILRGHWSSLAGSIEPASGIVELGGFFRSENLQSVTNPAGELRLTGTIDNTGGVLSLNARTGDLLAWDWTDVIGGTVVVASGTAFGTARVTNTGQRHEINLHNVHVIGDIDVRQGGGLTLIGSLTLDGTLRAGINALVGAARGDEVVLTGAANVVLDGAAISIPTALHLGPGVHISVPPCSGSCAYATSTIGMPVGTEPTLARFDSEATVSVGGGRTLMVGVHDWINRSTVNVAVGGRLLVGSEGVDNRTGVLRVDVAEGDAGLVQFQGTYSAPGAHLNGTLAVRAVDGYTASPDDVHEVVSFAAFDRPFDTIVTDGPGRVPVYHDKGIRIEAGEPAVEPLPPPPVEDLRADAGLRRVHLDWDMPTYDGELWTVVRGAEGDVPPATAAEGFSVHLGSRTHATHWHTPYYKDMSYSVFNRTNDGRTSEPVSVTLRGTRMTAETDRRVVTYGETVQISGTLSDNRGNPLAGKPVGIWRWRPTQPELGRTADDGSYTFAYAPETNGFHAAMFDGDATHMGIHTYPYFDLKVRSAVTANLTANRVRPGRRVYLRGNVGPNQSGETVRLLRKNADGWHAVREKALSSTSTFRFRLPTHTAGRTRYRVEKPADAEQLRGLSEIRRLVVRPVSSS